MVSLAPRVNGKKHIVILIPGFPMDEQDYLCVPPVQLLLQYINQELFDVSIIAFQYPYQSKEYSWKGYPVYAIGGNNKKGFGRLITWRKVLKTFRKIHHEKPVDRIHSFWLTECAFMGEKLSKGYEIPHSCSLMGQEALKGNKYMKSMKNLPPLAALSAYQQARFKTVWNKSVERVIPFGVERQPEFNVDRSIDVLGAGSLISLKQYDLFILIISELRKYGEVAVKMIGDGPEQARLKDLIAQYNLEDTIQLVGQIPRKELLGMMHRSKVFLHTSSYESYGMVLNEALSCGMQVISTPVGMAHQHTSIKTFKNVEEAVTLLRSQLEEKAVAIPNAYDTIEDTVKAYSDWWLED